MKGIIGTHQIENQERQIGHFAARHCWFDLNISVVMAMLFLHPVSSFYI